MLGSIYFMHDKVVDFLKSDHIFVAVTMVIFIHNMETSKLHYLQDQW